MKGWPILYRFPAASSHRWFPTSDQQLDDMVRFQRKPGSRRWSPASVGRRGSSGDFVTLPRSHSRWTAQGAPEPTLQRGASSVSRWQQAQQLEEVSSGVLHGLGIFEGCRCVFFFNGSEAHQMLLFWGRNHVWNQDCVWKMKILDGVSFLFVVLTSSGAWSSVFATPKTRNTKHL